MGVTSASGLVVALLEADMARQDALVRAMLGTVR